MESRKKAKGKVLNFRLKKKDSNSITFILFRIKETLSVHFTSMIPSELFFEKEKDQIGNILLFF